MVGHPGRIELLPQPFQLSSVRDRQREVVEPDTERVEPIGSTCLLGRTEEGDEHAVRIQEHRPWRLPQEPEAERVDVEALGPGKVANPKPQGDSKIDSGW